MSEKEGLRYPDWREMLDSIDGIDDRLNQVGVNRNVLRGIPEFSHNHEFEFDGAGFHFNVDNNSARLSWKSRLPSYLIPGGDPDGYNKFANFLLYEMPFNIYGASPGVNNPKGYYLSSRLVVDRNIEAANEELGFARKVVNFSDIDALFNFEHEFINKPEIIESIAAYMSPAYMHMTNESYKLEIKYPSKKDPKSSLSLQLPLEEHAIKPWSREELMVWVLQSHANISDVRDVELLSQVLAKKMGEFTADALTLKKRQK